MLSQVNDADCHVTNHATAEPKDWTITAGNVDNEICNCDDHKKRLRELTQPQYDHEVIQRAYIDGGQQPGDVPSGTQLMTDLNI